MPREAPVTKAIRSARGFAMGMILPAAHERLSATIEAARAKARLAYRRLLSMARKEGQA
jgi:hypothetical protein